MCWHNRDNVPVYPAGWRNHSDTPTPSTPPPPLHPHTKLSVKMNKMIWLLQLRSYWLNRICASQFFSEEWKVFVSPTVLKIKHVDSQVQRLKSSAMSAKKLNSFSLRYDVNTSLRIIQANQFPSSAHPTIILNLLRTGRGWRWTHQHSNLKRSMTIQCFIIFHTLTSCNATLIALNK